jgi:hypothetical protein
MPRFFVALLACLWACTASAFLLPSAAPRQRSSRLVMKAESSETVRVRFSGWAPSGRPLSLRQSPARFFNQRQRPPPTHPPPNQPPCHATARQLKKGELLDNVVKKAGVTKVMADKVISALTESIAESLTDGKKGGLV